jgi:hypothetical protein
VDLLAVLVELARDLGDVAAVHGQLGDQAAAQRVVTLVARNAGGRCATSMR